MRNRNRVLILTTLFLTLISFWSKAGDERVVLNKKASEITSGASFILSDDKFRFMKANPTGTSTSWDKTFLTKSIYNRITLSVDPYNRAVVAKYTFTVELQVSYEEWNYNTASFHTVQVSPNPVLTIDYDPSASVPIKDIAVYRFIGGNKFNVSILSVSPILVPVNVTMELQIEAERYYSFNRLDFTKNFDLLQSLLNFV